MVQPAWSILSVERFLASKYLDRLSRGISRLAAVSKNRSRSPPCADRLEIAFPDAEAFLPSPGAKKVHWVAIGVFLSSASGQNLPILSQGRTSKHHALSETSSV